ncbi:MAG: signal peptidase I [Candidatus Bathycorpusculaceae bacterium]
MKYAFIIPVLVLTVYLLTNLLVPFAFKDETIFIMDIILWATILPTTLYISKLTQTQIWRTNKILIQIAAIIAIFQTFLSIFMAFFMGFGKNANVWTPTALAIYFPFLLTPFLATEISRAYLTQTITKHKPTIALILISLFYTLLTPTIPNYLNLTSPLAIAEFLIRTFIPTLAISLLATYFAYLGALPANLAYMAIPALFTWFSPILPNIQWQTQSILTVTATTIGFIILDQTIKPLPKTQHERINIRRTTLKKGKSQLPYWTAIALIGLITVWSTTGLLGFTPTIIASESMTPTLNVGDIVIVLKTPTTAIKIGDIIQYQTTAEAPTIHRVIDKYETGGMLWFITQGDANNAPDNPINERQIMGKVILTIPKLGWISITLKEFAASTYTFITTLPNTLAEGATQILKNGVYITTALALTAYSYLLLTYKTTKKEEKQK